ncbi:rhomboid family intramembrane serine protease [Aestuariivivens sediminis]|uniref:rhomboid family intramembrane serine protease n=1 Tax=Aestuariivivens sediminis TaxID=2913557 RepID=UPI001F5914A3|nr:rhomboid family intramembrane serine protease [Aestuariivivens sediminis]
MTSLNQDIKNKLKRLNVFEKIIVINLVVFLLGLIYRPLLEWFELPSSFNTFILQPWSLVSYAFVHYEFMHILFNMLWLYIIAQWILNLFNPKMALNIYFLGAISGAVLYVLVYNLFPDVFMNSRLVGASASIRALLIFLCAYMPHKEFRFFTLSIKLWYIGLAIVILDVLGLISGIKDPIYGNSGGNIAHLGGAFLGYLYAKQLARGTDIGKGFEKFVDAIAGVFKFSNRKPFKKVHKNKNKVGGFNKSDFNEFNKQKKIDIILEKISKSGYESLTKEEKEFLFRAGK